MGLNPFTGYAAPGDTGTRRAPVPGGEARTRHAGRGGRDTPRLAVVGRRGRCRPPEGLGKVWSVEGWRCCGAGAPPGYQDARTEEGGGLEAAGGSVGEWGLRVRNLGFTYLYIR